MKIYGNIGRDPEKKTTKGGKPYYTFTVAESYGKEDNRTTNWFSISFFGDESKMEGLKKGVRVEVDGDLKVTQKDGKVFLDVLTSRVALAPLPPKKDGAGNSSGNAAGNSAGNNGGTAHAGVKDMHDLDDDIPF